MYFLIFLVGVSSAIIVETNKNIYNDIPSSGFVRGDQRVSHHPRRPQPFYYQDTYVYPRYEFDYTVSDKKTGDHKYHHEERDGPRVRGEYGLVEPDGSLRKVEYHADDHYGFNAVVSKSLQKHGNHAFSTMGHTRHFLPTGNEINTNHYFPRKYEYKPEVINDIKPVNDLEVTANMAEDMNRDISETDNKEVITLNKNQQNSVETTTFSVRTTEATKILPTTMSMNIEDVQPNNENSPTLSNEPISSLGEAPENKTPSDADVASSHFYSQYYYLGF